MNWFRRLLLVASVAVLASGCGQQAAREDAAAWRSDDLVGAWQLASAPSGTEAVRGMALRPDGSAVVLGPNGGDARWELRGDTLLLTGPGEAEAAALQLVELSDTALALTGYGVTRRFTRALLGELDGTVVYERPGTLPAGSVLTVTLEDVSRADAPSIECGRQVVRDPGASPVPFRIPYIATAIEPQSRYVLRARIDQDGRTLYRSTQAFPVITSGESGAVEVALEAAR